ncbi:hypothetical protein L9F63_017534, partial [Diploptera punctata]
TYTPARRKHERRARRTMFVRFGRGFKVRANGARARARASLTTIHSLSVFSTNTLMVRCLDLDGYLRGSLLSKLAML